MYLSKSSYPLCRLLASQNCHLPFKLHPKIKKEKEKRWHHNNARGCTFIYHSPSNQKWTGGVTLVDRHAALFADEPTNKRRSPPCTFSYLRTSQWSPQATSDKTINYQFLPKTAKSRRGRRYGEQQEGKFQLAPKYGVTFDPPEKNFKKPCYFSPLMPNQIHIRWGSRLWRTSVSISSTILSPGGMLIFISQCRT